MAAPTSLAPITITRSVTRAETLRKAARSRRRRGKNKAAVQATAPSKPRGTGSRKVTRANAKASPIAIVTERSVPLALPRTLDR